MAAETDRGAVALVETDAAADGLNVADALDVADVDVDAD